MTDSSVTDLLRRWSAGDGEAEGVLLAEVYGELKQIAARHFRREASGHTLQTTAVVHEAYLSLARSAPIEWRDRSHFFALMARAMRRVLVDHARRARRAKRGGGIDHMPFDDAIGEIEGSHGDIVALDDSLARLSLIDRTKARIIELRFFAGLTIEETAGCLGLSTATVVREWRRARAWLYRDIGGGETDGG